VVAPHASRQRPGAGSYPSDACAHSRAGDHRRDYGAGRQPGYGADPVAGQAWTQVVKRGCGGHRYRDHQPGPGTVHADRGGGRGPGNVLTAPAQAVACAACYGGYRVRYIGGSGKVVIAIQIPVSGPRAITVDYEIDGQREIKISSNGTVILTRTVTGSGWDVPQTLRFTTVLNAGPVLLTFYNDTSPAPDIDRVTNS
jgi:hypothetical protein